MSLTMVWSQTLSDGLVRADQVVGINVHQTPALTGKAWRHIDGIYSAIIDRVDNGLPGTLMVSHPGGIEESQVFLVASYVYAVSHGLAKP